MTLFKWHETVISKMKSNGMTRGGASVGEGVSSPPTHSNSIGASTSSPTNLRRKKEEMRGGRRKNKIRAP